MKNANANKKVKLVAVAAFFATVSTFSLANDSLVLGNEIDDSYYSENDAINAQEKSRSRAAISKPYTIRIVHKGGYIATFGARWTTAQGERVSSVHPYVAVGQSRTFSVPAGASNVSAYANYSNGEFSENPIFSQAVTQSVLDFGDPNLAEYHVWGSVFDPKWRLMK